jgi:hypothetical protein
MLYLEASNQQAVAEIVAFASLLDVGTLIFPKPRGRMRYRKLSLRPPLQGPRGQAVGATVSLAFSTYLLSPSPPVSPFLPRMRYSPISTSSDDPSLISSRTLSAICAV